MTTQSRTAVVTGSSSGIGAAIATRLLREGYNVVLNYSQEDARAQQALTECRQISTDVIIVKADVSNAADAANLINQSVQRFGAVDVLINNAARAIDRPILEMTEHEWDSVLNVNLKGAFLCAQHAARQMLRQDGGGIILNIGSSTGIRARRNGVNTCTSKAGLGLLTQCLALELGPKIRANTLIPGLTLTDETRKRFNLDDPQILSTRLDTIPLARIGQPDDVANAVMMMLSNDARFMTGQRLVVDGGQNMW